MIRDLHGSYRRHATSGRSSAMAASVVTVLVVGENSATPMDTDWWSYWNDETGFDLGSRHDSRQASAARRSNRGCD